VALSDTQVRRYARHVLLPEVGGRGQERLLAASVRVLGDGRAAEEAALYLAAAGIGRLHLDPTLAERLGPRLGAMNPDCVVAAGEITADAAGGVLTTRPAPPGDRLAGAQAALGALVALSGAGAAPTWRWEGARR
jgi:hypothetical protein